MAILDIKYPDFWLVKSSISAENWRIPVENSDNFDKNGGKWGFSIKNIDNFRWRVLQMIAFDQKWIDTVKNNFINDYEWICIPGPQTGTKWYNCTWIGDYLFDQTLIKKLNNFCSYGSADFDAWLIICIEIICK